MPELPALEPPDSDVDTLPLSRTPHPYHHHSADLPQSSERLAPNGHGVVAHIGALQRSQTAYPVLSKESTPASDSGTEADDEHFLKGLPAPRVKLHKGLRGRNESPSSFSTPIASPVLLEHDQTYPIDSNQQDADSMRRKRVLVRRLIETALIVALGWMVATNNRASPLVEFWHRDFLFLACLYTALLVLYPLRVVGWAYKQSSPSQRFPFKLASNFDPAPLLYPPTITILVSILVSVDNPAALLPNIILSISSIPRWLIPASSPTTTYDSVHWAFSCLPLIWPSSALKTTHQARLTRNTAPVSGEVAVLLYPLHQTLCVILHHLTTTSLLAAELQLLSISLIALLVLAVSPQMQVLMALLWIGGLGTLIFCSAVIRWGIVLARIPKWRFRRRTGHRSQGWKPILRLWSWHNAKGEVSGPTEGDKLLDTASSVATDDDESSMNGDTRRARHPDPQLGRIGEGGAPAATADQSTQSSLVMRRHSTPHLGGLLRKHPTHTPSGRRKRATSISMRPFLKMTQKEAMVRKWLYAVYVYSCILAIMLAGVRFFIQTNALGGEPIGWGLGYMFGDWNWFRFQVIRANLERWICLPQRVASSDIEACKMGWVERLRRNEFGEANTRLLLSGYWLLVLTFGLVVVFRLKDMYEVDTRRKVFHFTMVGMLLPGTFIDPAFAALALALMLAVFLILDLLRASQLPPLSKPIASFLAPYVDGRDFRGPVVISHIFLLIGCAIPLWLALAALPRTGNGPWAGWELATRDVSMVAGVVCVGLGDAAASLIGRRYGHHKWLWGGGKSLEGSTAFAFAVFAGLTAAAAWVRLGGWPVSDGEAKTSMPVTARNAGICAAMGSLTEAVLTGGNDNVIVPVILWTCVKSLGV